MCEKGIFSFSTRHLVDVQNSTSYPILVSLIESVIHYKLKKSYQFIQR